ncbi:MAG: hypothetical protein ACTSR0_02975 [Candidatus Asgardarchaeia archaeon]
MRIKEENGEVIEKDASIEDVKGLKNVRRSAISLTIKVVSMIFQVKIKHRIMKKVSHKLKFLRKLNVREKNERKMEFLRLSSDYGKVNVDEYYECCLDYP